LYAFKLALLTLFQSKNSFELQLQNEVSTANVNTFKRIYNWSPFMKVVYSNNGWEPEVNPPHYFAFNKKLLA